MKKLAFAVLIVGAVFALSQCELFNTTVEYMVTSTGFSSVSILYNDENGEGVRVDTTTPWSTSFDLFSSDRPFVAALRVTNYGLDAVDAYIREDGYDVDWVLGLTSGSSADLFAWIE